MKAIIIEDEKQSAMLLSNLLRDFCPEIKLTGAASNVADGFSMIKKLSPDVVFLDIEMQKETGFDLLKQFEKINFEIIFTTAYEKYALKAIKFCALDYLLKPIDVEELKTAVDRVAEKSSKQSSNKKFEALLQNMGSNPNQFQIALPSLEGISFVPVVDIIYCKAERQYTKFFLKSGETIMTSKNLGEYEELLSEHNFLRVHHSSLINLSEVKKYIRGEGGAVIMNNGVEIDVAKRRKEEFLKKFKSI